MSEELTEQEGGPNDTTAETEADLSLDQVLEDAVEDALDFVEGLLDAMDLDGEVAAEVKDGAIGVVVTGESSGILIGRHGRTLEAIQDLLRTAVQRQAQTRIRLTLDVEGYRDRRREAVAKQAREMAERAVTEGEVELPEMSAFERKVVHDVVSTIEGVTSFSEGEEPRRRVIIQSEE
jgi:spoIIIJ-associated protein